MIDRSGRLGSGFGGAAVPIWLDELVLESIAPLPGA